MASRRPYYKQAPAGDVYSVVATSGALTGVAANGPVWSFEWTNAAKAAVIHRVIVDLAVTTAYGTAQPTSYGLYFARSFTAADTTGVAVTLTTNNGKHRTSFATMLAAAICIGDTDVITAGTRTLDAQPLRVARFASTALATTGSREFIFGGSDDREPLVIKAQEGLVLNNLVLMGATGVVTLDVTLEWSEVNTSWL